MPVSSARITSLAFVLLLLVELATANPALQSSSAPAANGHGNTATGVSALEKGTDPAKLFQRGQNALTHGQLDDAERDFRAVLQIDPQSGAAYANLGVVYMRRKQWNRALEALQKAEHLIPQVAGIRLNIGLAYYRQNEFLKAIPPFESVLRDQPDSLQARYLLGQCYFFADRWAEAANTLEPLWTQESEQLPYLYVLSNAAHRAGRKDLDDRATTQLIKLSDGSPEYHLFVGKYHLNLGQYDAALAEFQAAADGNPKLPFVHFNLGYTHLKKQQYPLALQEFQKDAAIEPDVALNYDAMGDVYWLMQDDKNAEKSYREALSRDPRLVNPHLGLARIYQREEKYSAALVEIEAAGKLDPARTDVHYMHGQVLLHLGRKQEAKKELEAAALARDEPNSGPEKQVKSVPSPEILQDPQ
jgi:tetratricopeptide (TPR) repeat protein